MIINSIRLVNIRSFVDETITFPQGIVLLSGDIGSGKTTILLGVEFAIFGVMKGVISGTSLLRNGSSSGYVELNFSVDNQEVVIKRTLKKTSVGIAQEAGSLSINGHVFEGSPQELKSKMLELLGYPESLLTKSKSLVFRYTVFTAQEEMKKILFESREERLDILRRLFNLDKYKRVKENTLNYTRELKNQVSFIEGTLYSLPEKKKELGSVNHSILELSKETTALDSEIAHATQEVISAEAHLRQLEAEVEHANKLDKEFEVKKSELASLTKQLERSQVENERLKTDIDLALTSFDGFDMSKETEIKERIAAKTVELKSYQEKFNQIITKRAENLSKKTRSEEVLAKLSSLDNQCPMCLQKIAHEHMDDVKIRENQIIHVCNSNLAKLAQFEAQFNERKLALEKELENYSKGEREFAVKKAKFEALDEKKKRKQILEVEISQLTQNIHLVKARMDVISKEALAFASKKLEFAKSKQALDEKREIKNKLLQHMAKKKAQAETMNTFLVQLDIEIRRLTKDEARLVQLKARRSWLEEDFVGLADMIEKSVLFRIYAEFNSFFQTWFNTLLEDEAINVRLDDYFSVLVEQNGYETNIENLSGGEKTSVALAYRLALNKVINDFMTSIKTRDLIILDEPTEGFSAEQLDRVREVLRQTGVAQTIIVSHEAKMEGFVDHIVRVQKQNHVSKIA
jgi:DNA repair protein SbcC/Rad50